MITKKFNDLVNLIEKPYSRKDFLNENWDTELELNNKEITEDTSSKAYLNKLNKDGVQYFGLKNQFNYDIKQVRIDNDNKTFEIGVFKILSGDEKTKNRKEFERVIQGLKDKGYAEVKSANEVKEKLKEEYGPYGNNIYLEQIADELENGSDYGYIDGHKWELRIIGNNGDITEDTVSSAMYDILLHDISLPVRDGHKSYDSVDFILVNEEDITKEDLEYMGFDEEDIEAYLKDSGTEIETYYDYEIDTGDWDIEEDSNDEDDDLEYDRRKVEKQYGLEDGELDGVSIRDAEEMVGEEEGALDKFLYNYEGYFAGEDENINEAYRGNHNTNLVGFKIGYVHGSHPEPEGILSLSEINEWIKNEDEKSFDNGISDEAYIRIIFDVDDKRVSDEFTINLSDGKEFGLDSVLVDEDRINKSKKAVEEFVETGNTHSGRFREEEKEEVDLPTEVTYDFYNLVDDDVDITSDDYNLDEVIADRLSDDYGYTHFGFNYDVDKRSGDVYVYNIKWDLEEKLIQGKSDATLKKNIKTEIEAGKDPKQAYAIAKSIQKKNIKEYLSAEEINSVKDTWVKTKEDEEVWNSLSDEDKEFLALSLDMGFWFDEIQGNEELENEYYTLRDKFSVSKNFNKETDSKLKESTEEGSAFDKFLKEDLSDNEVIAKDTINIDGVEYTIDVYSNDFGYIAHWEDNTNNGLDYNNQGFVNASNADMKLSLKEKGKAFPSDYISVISIYDRPLKKSVANKIMRKVLSMKEENLREEDLTEGRKRTRKEIVVLQGNYGYGWDDLVEYELTGDVDKDMEIYKEIRQDKKDYKENEPQYNHRTVHRFEKITQDDTVSEDIKDKNLKENLDNEICLYLFPELTDEDKKELANYNLTYLGKNSFKEDDYESISDVVRGSKEDLIKYGKEYLDYTLHPDYLYLEDDFAGDIINEGTVIKTNLDINNMADELRKQYKGVTNKDYIKNSIALHRRFNMITWEEARQLAKEFNLEEKLKEEFEENKNFKVGDKVKISDKFHVDALRNAEGIITNVQPDYEFIDIKFTSGPEKGEEHPYTAKNLVKIEEDWAHFEYKSGANPYIAKTEKEKQRILKKYKDKVKEVKPNFYKIDDMPENIEEKFEGGKTVLSDKAKERLKAKRASLTEVKHDLYVNGKYVASTQQYKRAKDWKDKILQDRKVVWAGMKSLMSGGTELDSMDIKPEDKVVVRRDKNEAMESESKEHPSKN